MTINWLDVNVICWILAFWVAGLSLAADSVIGTLLDGLKAGLLVAAGIIAGVFNWEGSVFVASLTICGIFLVDYWLDSVKMMFVKI